MRLYWRSNIAHLRYLRAKRTAYRRILSKTYRMSHCGNGAQKPDGWGDPSYKATT